MLILAKTALAMMLGFIFAIICGLIFIPFLKKLHFGQHVSQLIGERHLKKEGTPTMGGIIFIFPVLITLFLLYLRGSIQMNHNLTIVLLVFISYAILGFIDDWLKVRYHNNQGLRISTKFLLQMIIALIFFYIFMKNGGQPIIDITSLNIAIPMGWTFGLFILFLLVGSSNAVNITDGLDGLCGGLSVIAFVALGIITWNTTWMEGYQEVAIFCFVLVGALIAFLIYNSHPAKVFMGDMGSLALGAALASVAIISNHEITLVIVAGVFIIETLSVIIQLIAIKKFHTKVFKMAPLHHHFEQLGWSEVDIVRLFWTVGLILSMAAIGFGVWL